MDLPKEVLALKKNTEPKPKLSLKDRPKATKSTVVKLDWRGRAAELISLKLGPTSQTYIDRAMDALTTVWDVTYPIEGRTEEERDKQARRQAQRQQNLRTIAIMCNQAAQMKGTPQERAHKIINALITRKLPDIILLFIEMLVKRSGVSAYYEYRRYESHTAINPNIALANLERMRECHALNGDVLDGEDGEVMFAEAFFGAHDHGEDAAPGEDHARDAPSANDPIPIAAINAEDAELSALGIQQWASAFWRLMTNNPEQNDVLPFAIERVDTGVYRNYTGFTEFCDYRTEQYNARLTREKEEGLKALETVRNTLSSDGFTLPGDK